MVKVSNQNYGLAHKQVFCKHLNMILKERKVRFFFNTSYILSFSWTLSQEVLRLETWAMRPQLWYYFWGWSTRSQCQPLIQTTNLNLETDSLKMTYEIGNTKNEISYAISFLMFFNITHGLWKIKKMLEKLWELCNVAVCLSKKIWHR